MASIPLGRFVQLIIYICLSIALMLFDHRSSLMQPLRHSASLLINPLQDVARLPTQAYDWFGDVLKPFNALRAEYVELEKQNQVLMARLQQLESIEQENKRLSDLLSASKKVADDMLLAELVEVSLDPFTHRVLINKGSRDSVYVGQAVIDTEGVVGQVTEVTLFRSAVTLITDPNHAIPVQVRRNGLRAIVQGEGSADQVNVPFLAPHADIRNGDVLITSGMGGRFPPGYPVARVSEIIKDANAPFLLVSANPVARLDYASEVLLVWPGQPLEHQSRSPHR